MTQKKGDWINEKTKDVFNTMKIEVHNINPTTIINHLKNSEFVEKFSSSKITSAEIEDDLKLYENNITDSDTIVVPAREDSFNNLFLGENRWYSIKVSDYRIPYIKYIAAYQTAPISAITHYAKVSEIKESHEDSTKKIVLFDGEVKELDRPVKLGNITGAMQTSRYTKFDKLIESEDLDELFGY